MKLPSLAYYVHLSRMLHMPVTDVMLLPLNEVVMQQAFDLIHTDEFKNKYDLEEQMQMSEQEQADMRKALFSKEAKA